MGKHRYMRVMINGKKIHTTGGFNKVIENAIDFGKWPDEIFPDLAPDYLPPEL